MSIVTDLGYRFPTPNLFQRLMQRIGSTRVGAKTMSLTLRHLDSLVLRLSGGRTTAVALLAGLVALDVTTIGRRSGRPRTSHLIAIPYGERLALLGTNFGGVATPAWVYNIEAHPEVSLSYGGRTVETTARLATAEETEAVLAVAETLYVGYRKYQQRITGRTLRIFLLG
ncbi:MAG: nitroreductase family deazaflavin-dependent oxidoreductase [Nocardioides sp.]|uniref:nitroreductase family deazaflavin-dependent oxidoreductase n=1 Tax=Nocardioides sp. TaxID=35761 RepID=UPI0039E271D4